VSCLGGVRCSFCHAEGVHVWCLWKYLCQMHLERAACGGLMCVLGTWGPFVPQGSDSVAGTGVPAPCLAWAATRSLAWCPRGETAGVMLCLSSGMASQTSPGQCNQGEHVLHLTAGVISFLSFLFFICIYNPSKCSGQMDLKKKKSMPVSCYSGKATSSEVDLVLKKTLRTSTVL